MKWIVENWELVLAIWGGLVTVASSVVKLTPTPRDDAALAAVLRVVGHVSIAKPKEPGSVPPKPPRSRPPATPTTFAMLLALVLVGCAGRAAGAHVEAARASSTLVDAAGEALEAVCTVEALRAAQTPRLFGERCEKARDAQHVAVELMQTWFELGQADKVDVDSVLVVARRLVATYDEVRGFLALVGRELPALEVPR
ncbi:MAG: hypothetical protein AAF447_27850 [Myxococcota bacterium]